MLIAGVALYDLQVTVTERRTALTQVSDGQLTSVIGQTVLPRQLLSYTHRSTHISIHTGAAEPRGSGGQLTPTFQVQGPHMALDPHFLLCSLVSNL